MGLVERITVENSQDEIVKQTLARMVSAVGAVPETLRFTGNSPGLLSVLTSQIGYYQNHPHLGPELLTLIRYTAASHFRNRACVEFNGGVLKRQGMTEADLEAVLADPENAPLDARDRALLSFVYDGVRDQGSATRERMEELRSQGWNTSDIIDAVNHGFFMYAPGRMLELFRMYE